MKWMTLMAALLATFAFAASYSTAATNNGRGASNGAGSPQGQGKSAHLSSHAVSDEPVRSDLDLGQRTPCTSGTRRCLPDPKRKPEPSLAVSDIPVVLDAATSGTTNESGNPNSNGRGRGKN